MGLEPGYSVSSQVKLVRQLRRGGMGSVWVGEHTALGTEVAVKFISGNLSDNKEMVARFNREATSAARIKSPHIVQIHDHGITADGLPFMVMELLDGEDLSMRMKRVGKLPLADVASIVVQTCRVLAKAHRLDIVHRDIKPGNIFLVDTDDTDIFIKLLDFGIAKTGYDPSEMTGTGAIVGTLCYMSPEQLTAAKSVDPRADLWSLGVVAYRALTADLPFKDDDGLGTLLRNMETGLFPPPTMLVPELPPSIDGFFERLFRKDPNARFANAKEMADAFVRAAGDSIPASVGRFSVLLGADEKTGNPATADLPSAVTGKTVPPVAEPSKASPPSSPPPAIAPSDPPDPDKAPGAGGEPEGTLSGTASSPPPLPKPTSKSGPSRRWVAAVAALVLAFGLWALWSATRNKAPSQTSSLPPPQTNSQSPGPTPSLSPDPSPPVQSGPRVTPTPSPEAPTVTPSAAATATVSPSSEPTTTATAAPGPSASASSKTKPRWKKPEKDYGF